VDRIQKLVQARFKKRACLFQIETARALYTGRHVIGCAATGLRKDTVVLDTLLMALEEGLDVMIFVITPLNLLGKQNEEVLREAEVEAVAVSRENATESLFQWEVTPDEEGYRIRNYGSSNSAFSTGHAEDPVIGFSDGFTKWYIEPAGGDNYRIHYPNRDLIWTVRPNEFSLDTISLEPAQGAEGQVFQFIES
ncbi:hypothetical protein AN958_09177, partial [Leucoagaricus sp. SymC.cos]